jgi:hypothetical protein
VLALKENRIAAGKSAESAEIAVSSRRVPSPFVTKRFIGQAFTV